MKDTLNKVKALADGNRLRVIAALMQYGELCACQITELLQVAGATTSRHMSILSNAGLIQSRKEGRWVYYKIEASASGLQPLLAWIDADLKQSETISADTRLLEDITSCEPEDLCRKQRGEQCCPKTNATPTNTKR